MVKTIKLFNPKNILSNNYSSPIIMDGEEWPTPSHYIYSSILKNKKRLKKAKITFLKPFVNNLYLEEINNEIKEYLKTALEANFNQNEDFKEELLNTGTGKLFYESENPYIGIGKDGKGFNLLGKLLMQLRHDYNQKLKKEEEYEKNNRIYDTFIAEKILLKEISEGNDIKSFYGKTIDEIINDVEIKVPDKNVVISNKNLLNPILETKNASLLIDYIRKKELRNLQKIQKEKQKSIIFNSYINYILEKKYPTINPLDYEKIKKQSFTTKQLLKIEQKLDEMQDKLPITFETIDIVSDDEIFEAESVEIPDIQQEEIEEKNDEPNWIVHDKGILSPNSISNIIIDDKVYPTVMFYVVSSLLKGDTTHTNIEKMYDHYITLKNEEYKKLLQSSAMKVMDKKFEKLTFKNALLNTGNSKLIWNDMSDPILGGKTNFVGKYLMKIRNRIKKEGEEALFVEEEVIRLMIRDEYVKSWVIKKIKDMCRTVDIIQEYKQGENAKTILELFYSQCPSFSVKSIPEIIKNNCDLFSREEMEIVWGKIAFLLHQLKQWYTQVPNIAEDILKSVDIYNSKRCDTDCIISALRNIIKNLDIVDDNVSFLDKVKTAVFLISGIKELKITNEEFVKIPLENGADIILNNAVYTLLPLKNLQNRIYFFSE